METIRWLRALVVRTVVRRLAVEALLLVVVGALVLLAVGTAMTPPLLGVLLGSGALWALGRAAAAAATNPLSRRYVRSYVQQPFLFEIAPLDPAESPQVKVLGRFGFLRAGAIRDHAGNPSLSFELMTVPSRLVCAAVGSTPDSTVLLSRLSDGRVLVSSSLLVPPGRDLVVNVVPAADEGSLAIAHHDALARMAAGGTPAVVTPPATFLDLVRLERDAYRALGPWCASFLDLTGRGDGARLLVPVPAASIFDRCTGAVPASAAHRSTGLRVASPHG